MVSRVKYLLSWLYIKIKERHFVRNGNDIKYVYQSSRKNNKTLVVVFPAFPGKNRPGRYNYIRTLQKSTANKLFLLDDAGYSHVGSYMLGNQMKWYNDKTVSKLIDYIKEKCGAKKLVLCGSSKGGSSALIYGLGVQGIECHIVVGSPQYRISDYLHLNQYHENILRSILPKETNDCQLMLNQLIHTQIIKNANRNNTTVYLMISSKERSYEIDVKHLIQSLVDNQYSVHIVDKEFKEHSDTGAFFIPYLKEIVSNIGEE